MHSDATTVENSVMFPQKVKNRTPYDLTIALEGIYQKNIKTLIQRNICTAIFIATLFTIAKSGNDSNVHQLING